MAASKESEALTPHEPAPIPPPSPTPRTMRCPGSSCCRCPYIPKRYVTIIMLCLGMLIVHAMRVNVAVTVVTIIDKEAHMKVGTQEAIDSLPDADAVNATGAVETLPDAMWDNEMIGFLHSIFYIGYLFTQLPGGYLAQSVPAHRLFGCCILISCSLNLILPTAFREFGYVFTCIIRTLQGLSEGVLYPSCYAVMRHWTTPEERSRLGAIVLTGVYIGPVIGLMASGWLTHYTGWPYVYYIHGAAGMVWFIVWLFLSYETPATHPTISPEELKLINEAQGITALIYKDDKVPWKAIFCSIHVWALNVCNFARSFVFFFLLTNEPTFLNVFGYTLAENGVLSALPHALMALVAALSGPLADHLMTNPMLTRTQVRKIFTCLGFGVESVCLYFLGVITDGMTALVFLTIGVGISGLTISGWQINHLDIAPRYASVIVGITTACGTIAGIINPLIVSAMTEEQLISQWQHVFLLTGSVMAMGAAFYFFFGSGDLQPWAEPQRHKEVIRVIDSPLDNGQKPYGTFTTQQDYDDQGGQLGEKTKLDSIGNGASRASRASASTEVEPEKESTSEKDKLTENSDGNTPS